MNDCISTDWTRNNGGYGVKSRRLAHREAWEAANGEAVPPGLVVMHICDNPPCVNPEHLRVGTYAENVADMKAKGRGMVPVAHCMNGHEFTEESTYIPPNGGTRQCRICRQLAEKRRAKRVANGDPPTLSEETRAKMSAASRGRPKPTAPCPDCGRVLSMCNMVLHRRTH